MTISLKQWCLLGATIATLPQAAVSQKQKAEEQAIVRAVDNHNSQAVALLEQIVNINSGTQNFPGVRRVAFVLRMQLDSMGFITTWVDGSPFQRAGHLVASRYGKKGAPKVLLIGHLDTVFEPNSPFQKVEKLNDSTWKGPGIIDMKGGDVIAVSALRALRDAKLLDRLNVTVVFTGDEESAGRPLSLARAALRDAAKGAQYAIGFEDGAMDPKTAVIARRSAGGWTLRVTGTPAHSGQIFKPDVGAGAVFETSRILHEFYSKLSNEQYLTFNPGFTIGGTQVMTDSAVTTGSGSGKTNVVPKAMAVGGDLRAISAEQLARARQTMRDIVAAHLPLTDASIEFEDSYPPLAPTDGNKRLLAIHNQASIELGFGAVDAVDPSRAGAADVSFVADIVPMIIDGIGLSGGDDHTDKEWAQINMLPVLTKRAAVTLYRLSIVK